MRSIPVGIRLRMFGRLLLLQSTWSFERMQGLGFAWALEPWLERLYPRAAERREALARHAEYFNTQPYVASLILGLACALEETSAGMEPSERAAAQLRLATVKKAMGSSLAGLGDSFFWTALRPAAAALALAVGIACLFRSPRAAGFWMAAVYLVAYNAPALWLRWRGIALGYLWREQLPAKLKPFAAQDWVRRLRVAGSAAAAALLLLLAAHAGRGPRALGGVVLGLAWLGYWAWPSRVTALRLYGVASAAGWLAGAAGWL